MQLAVIRHYVSDFVGAGVKDVRVVAAGLSLEFKALYGRSPNRARLEAVVKDEMTLTCVRGFVTGLRALAGVANDEYRVRLTRVWDGWMWVVTDQGALVSSGHVFAHDRPTAEAFAHRELERLRFEETAPPTSHPIRPTTIPTTCNLTSKAKEAHNV